MRQANSTIKPVRHPISTVEDINSVKQSVPIPLHAGPSNYFRKVESIQLYLKLIVLAQRVLAKLVTAYQPILYLSM